MSPSVDPSTKTTGYLDGGGLVESIERKKQGQVEHPGLLHNDSTTKGSDSYRIYQDSGAPAWDLKLASVLDGKAVP